jgi:hypothetical protein
MSIQGVVRVVLTIRAIVVDAVTLLASLLVYLAVVRTKLVSVSRLDDATLPVVPWSALTSSRRAPSPRRL